MSYAVTYIEQEAQELAGSECMADVRAYAAYAARCSDTIAMRIAARAIDLLRRGEW